jgi:dTDP-4-dehydrorhamnose 3,5-epimerase
MECRSLSIPDVKVLTLERHEDSRGWFCEAYSRKAYAAAGIATEFVQDNQSHSTAAGTLRGLHFQAPPFAQDKLVYTMHGRIWEVAVDIRAGSPSYGRHVAIEMSADVPRQLYVPAGFAHGFLTLEPDTLVVYKVSSPYAPGCDRGLKWSDPVLGIAWPMPADKIILSDKDRQNPLLKDMPAGFRYGSPGGVP